MLGLISHILQSDEVKYIREALKQFFPFQQFHTLIGMSIFQVNQFMKDKEEPKWDEQDYDEMRDEVYRTISDIYYELYVNRELTRVEIRETVEGKLRASPCRVREHPVRRVPAAASAASCS